MTADASASDVRAAVCAAAHHLSERNMILGTAGNISVRVGDLIAITATGATFATLSEAEVALVDRDGAAVNGGLAPSSELGLHRAIYDRFGAGAVVHTHPPFGTALACVLDELPALHYAIVELGGAIRVAPYATYGTRELAGVTLAALEGRTAALMSNHGAIAYGDDLERALARAELLEWLCALHWRAASLGPVRPLSDAQLQEVADTIARSGYAHAEPL